MEQVWLGNNGRISWFLVAVFTFLCFVSLLVACVARDGNAWPVRVFRWVAWLSFAGSGVVAIWQMCWLRTPRLAYVPGHLLVYLRGLRPIRVPIGCVECFFLGQAPGLLGQRQEVRSSAVVVRLAESATEWKQIPVATPLGTWRDGYIIIRGTWCEPLDASRVNRMNHDLAQAKRKLQAGD